MPALASSPVCLAAAQSSTSSASSTSSTSSCPRHRSLQEDAEDAEDSGRRRNSWCRRQPIIGQKGREMPTKPQAQKEEKNGLAASATAPRLRQRSVARARSVPCRRWLGSFSSCIVRYFACLADRDEPVTSHNKRDSPSRDQPCAVDVLFCFKIRPIGPCVIGLHCLSGKFNHLLFCQFR